MSRSIENAREVVRGVFHRISSDGKDPVSRSFSADAIYDFPYSDVYIRGSSNLDIVFSQVLPKLLLKLQQWPIAIYPITTDEDTLLVEYASHATSAHTGKIYRNRYAAVMKLVDDKIDFWREYYNVDWFDDAVGPEFPRMLGELLPANGFALQSQDDSNVRRWKTPWVLNEFDHPPA